MSVGDIRKIVQCSITGVALVLSSACAAEPGTEEAVGTVVSPSSEQPWRAVDASTGQITDVAELEQLVRDFPNSSSVRLRLLNAHLEAEDTDAALEVAVSLIERGYAFSDGAREFLTGLGPSPEQLAVLQSSEAAGGAIAPSEAEINIPPEALLVESAWRDPANGDFYATSIVGRSLWVKRGASDWAPVPSENAGSLTGMVFDPGRRLLWIASGVVDVTPDPETAFRGLLAIDPATGQEVTRVAGSPDSNPSDIALAYDGTVYASDPLSGAIYRAKVGADVLETILSPGTLRSPQGLVPRDGGKRLIVSDYRYGLAMIDTATGAVSRLTADQPMLLDGIDGLWLHEGELVAVQNGISPMRIVALALSEDGNRITGMRVLERAHPAWTEPLGGSIYEGALYYIGNGQWNKFTDGGALGEGAELVPTQIRRLELGETNR